jgi:outer membrane protein assembly factor BamC
VNRFAPFARQLTSLACAATLTGFLSGCSTFEESKIDYKQASQKMATLEVPPDLTQLRRDSRYQVSAANSASSAAAVGAMGRPVNDAGIRHFK